MCKPISPRMLLLTNFQIHLPRHYPLRHSKSEKGGSDSWLSPASRTCQLTRQRRSKASHSLPHHTLWVWQALGRAGQKKHQRRPQRPRTASPRSCRTFHPRARQVSRVCQGWTPAGISPAEPGHTAPPVLPPVPRPLVGGAYPWLMLNISFCLPRSTLSFPHHCALWIPVSVNSTRICPALQTAISIIFCKFCDSSLPACPTASPTNPVPCVVTMLVQPFTPQYLLTGLFAGLSEVQPWNGSDWFPNKTSFLTYQAFWTLPTNSGCSTFHFSWISLVPKPFQALHPCGSLARTPFFNPHLEKY